MVSKVFRDRFLSLIVILYVWQQKIRERVEVYSLDRRKKFFSSS